MLGRKHMMWHSVPHHLTAVALPAALQRGLNAAVLATGGHTFRLRQPVDACALTWPVDFPDMVLRCLVMAVGPASICSLGSSYSKACPSCCAAGA